MFLGNQSFSQDFFRIKADFTIKFKAFDGSKVLSKGKVYYDTNYKTTVYIADFPEKETWATIDTVMYVIKNGQIKDRQKVPSLAEFSIFHMILNGSLQDYGLAESPFYIDKVEYENELVVSTWLPPNFLRDKLGKILISTKEKRLHGIVFFDANEKIVSKQFFLAYKNINGLEVPTEIRQISYVGNDENKKNLQMIKLNNIFINELKEESIYNYQLPDN